MSDVDLTNSVTNKPLEFTGKGAEYFSIWVVNVVLTALTLGIYSAWAKVRTQQYFYGNTKLDGASFQYLADPKRILVGRAIAFVIFVAYYAATMISPKASLIIALTLLALAPVFLVMSMSFQLRNSAYRHVSFAFQKDFLGAYKVFALPIVVIGGFMLATAFFIPEELMNQDQQDASYEEPYESAAAETYQEESDAGYGNEEYSEERSDELVLNDAIENASSEADDKGVSQELKIYLGLQAAFMIALILLSPFWDYLFTRYRAIHSQYGTQAFNFNASAGNFYGVYIVAFAVFILIIVGMGFMVGFLTPLLKGMSGEPGSEAAKQFGVLIFFAVFLVMFPAYLWFFAYIQAKRTNLIYNHLELDGHKVKCEMKTGYLMYLYITNTVAMALTLGLLMPWAKVRTARYRVSVTSLDAVGDLGGFAAAQQKQQSALGEELGGMFDMEVGF